MLCSLRLRFFTKIQIIWIFRWGKKRCIQKGLFFIHFRRSYPQYRRYPWERITRLLPQSFFDIICLHTSNRFDHREYRMEFSMRAVRSSENVTNMPVKTKQNRTEVVKWEYNERSENLQHGSLKTMMNIWYASFSITSLYTNSFTNTTRQLLIGIY